MDDHVLRACFTKGNYQTDAHVFSHQVLIRKDERRWLERTYHYLDFAGSGGVLVVASRARTGSPSASDVKITMRSEIRFVMHPSDEKHFAAEVLLDETVLFIDGPRWKNETPQTVRTLEGIAGFYCIIWSPSDLPSLTARYIPSCDDWYCNSESATLQFLRSRLHCSVVTERRLAINTSNSEDLSIENAAALERRFKLLSRFIKKRYSNSILQWCNPTLPLLPARPGRSGNPSKPDPQVWVGPYALQWLREDQTRRVKQDAGAIVEAALVPDPGPG
jgi:hypothetical protein